MKKLLYLVLAVFCFSFNTKEHVQLEKVVSDFEIVVSLQDRDGDQVSTDTLRGYYAYNLDTRTYYYDNPRIEAGVISNLPAGTYRVGAYDGYFDGASSQIVTIDASDDETVEVTLQYWVE